MPRICPHCDYDLDRGLVGPGGVGPDELGADELRSDAEPSELCPDCEADVCLHCPGECPSAGARTRATSSARAA